MPSLQEIICYAVEHAPGFKKRMEAAGLSPEEISSIDKLQKIPVLKKDKLIDLQKESPPFGGLATAESNDVARIFMSPGPIYDPQSNESDFWRFSEALLAAGFNETDIVQNTFSYHLSPAGFMFDSALRKLGATVVPAGTGNRELQIQIMQDLKVTGYVGTPSFFAMLLDAAEEKGLSAGKELHIEKVFFTAEMITMEMRKRCADYGISVNEGYGTADCGCLAYEDKKGPGLKITSSAIVQLCDPHTGQEITNGEGEVVVTLLDKAYPLIRFGTGDLSKWVDGHAGKRLAGVLGRVSDGIKVKGMFVREKQLAQVLDKEGYTVFQGIVTRENNQDRFEIFIESEEELADSLLWKVHEIIRVTPILTRINSGEIDRSLPRMMDQRLYQLDKR